MARSLSQALTPFSTISTTRLLTFRHRSTSPVVVSGEAEDTAAERVAMKKLEEAIHKIIVRRSQPDWIVFVPGTSYWVPPKSKAQGLAQVIGKLIYDNNVNNINKTNCYSNNYNNFNSTLMKDDKVSLYYNCGWPSSTHFFKGTSHSPLEGEIIPKNTSQSEDEEA